MLEKDKVLEIIDRLMDFNFNFYDEDVFIESIGSSESYDRIIKALLKEIKFLLNEIFRVPDNNVKIEILQEIYELSIMKEEVKVDLSKYIYKVEPPYEDEPEVRFPLEHYKLKLVYTSYCSNKKKLLDLIESELLKAGYRTDGKIVSPISSETIIQKLEIRSKLDVKQLGYLLFLLNESDIFSTKRKSDIAQLISNNFLNNKNEYFSKDSIANKMIPNPIESVKISVKSELEKLIKKIK